MRAYSSLRWRLTYLIFSASALAACLAAAGFTWFDVQRYREHVRDEVKAISSIVADQVGPAIMLGDGPAAADILGSLRAAPNLRRAELLDRSGREFASMNGDRDKRGPEELVVRQPVLAGNERIGTLVVTARMPTIMALVRQYLGGAAPVLLISMVVAVGMAAMLQSRVSAPILQMAQIAKKIARTHCFTDRVAAASNDEVGELASSFNSMLQEIERRDVELAEQHRSLEQEILERNAVNLELQSAKEKAESVARLKTEFLANMSHEIRTPMNGILGMTDLALSTPLTATQSEYLGGVKTSAESLLRIIDDILDVSKLEAGKLQIEASDFDLRATVRGALRLFEIPARARGLELGDEIAPECPKWAHGDPGRLRQMLINLVGNAIKFTPSGRVSVSVRPAAGDRLWFTVEDSGIGISPEKLDGVFEPFTQADGSHTRRFGGTGLGLTITRKLAGLMGGRVWAESEIGRGSRFHLELPLPEREAPRSQEAQTAAAVLPPMKVLVAEDNVVNQKVICSLLRLAGSVASLAENGAEAYQLFRQEDFDLILMDIQMPEVDGLTATGLIREEERRRKSGRIPILALTAHTSAGQHEQCLERGMDGVITKPVSRDKLLRTIAEILERVGG